MQDDPYELDRFVKAQAPLFDGVVEELRAARKRTHWMWFIFPQHRHLGRSHRAEFYGIRILDEARAYLAHPVLGPRLELCTQTVLDCSGASLYAIFGSPDDAKFRSCMTLFSLASGEPENLFSQAIDRWCGGEMDEQTVALVKS
jgi:uncharacterized protein (DUF1810 family)